MVLRITVIKSLDTEVQQTSLRFSQCWASYFISLRHIFFYWPLTHAYNVTLFLTDQISLVWLTFHLTVGNPTVANFRSSREWR